MIFSLFHSWVFSVKIIKLDYSIISHYFKMDFRSQILSKCWNFLCLFYSRNSVFLNYSLLSPIFSLPVLYILDLSLFNVLFFCMQTKFPSSEAQADFLYYVLAYIQGNNLYTLAYKKCFIINLFLISLQSSHSVF